MHALVSRSSGEPLGRQDR